MEGTGSCDAYRVYSFIPPTSLIYPTPYSAVQFGTTVHLTSKQAVAHCDLPMTAKACATEAGEWEYARDGALSLAVPAEDVNAGKNDAHTDISRDFR